MNDRSHWRRITNKKLRTDVDQFLSLKWDPNEKLKLTAM